MILEGKNILVTGGTSGLGLAIARELITRGAVVYAMGRSLKGNYPENVSYRFIYADFTDLLNVKNSLNALLDGGVRFDIVVSNAGVLTTPEYRVTVNGFEHSFQVNFLSHLLINEIILGRESYNEKLALLAVTSPVYKYYRPDFVMPSKESFRFFRIYSESKYYMLLLGDFLKKEFPDSGFGFIGFNPGIFSSRIYRMQGKWFHYLYRVGAPFMRNPEKAAWSACNALENESAGFNSVFTRRGGVSYFQPSEKLRADSFMKTCHDALKAVPGLY